MIDGLNLTTSNQSRGLPSCLKRRATKSDSLAKESTELDALIGDDASIEGGEELLTALYLGKRIESKDAKDTPCTR